MSTKKLNRTIIEGGRHRFNKWERYFSNRRERAQTKEFLNIVQRDIEYVDEDVVPVREKVGKSFADKLRPLQRWLLSKVGEPWDKTKSEIFEKFDTRTVAGRHIIFDHLLDKVNDARSGHNDQGLIAADIKSYSERYYEFFVDDEGILRKCAIRDRSQYEKISSKVYQEVGKWLNGRMIIEENNKLYWMTPSSGIWKSEWISLPISQGTTMTWGGGISCRAGIFSLKYLFWENSEHLEPIMARSWYYPYKMEIVGAKNQHGWHWEHIPNPANFKWRGELLPNDFNYFKSLPVKIQQEILDYTKNR